MCRSVVPLIVAVAAAGCGSSIHAVSDSPIGSYEAALTGTAGRLVAGWYDTRDGSGDIYIRELDADGVPAGPERRLTTGPEASYEVSLDAAGASLAAAWYDKSADGSLTAYVGILDAAGTQRWLHSLGGGTRNPVVRAHGDRVFCAWIAAGDAGESVWAGWWDAAGTPRGIPQRVGAASRTTWNLNAAVDDDGVGWVVYDAAAGTRSDELFLGRVDAAQVSLERISEDDGVSSKYPDIAVAGGRMALTWFETRDQNSDVFLRIRTKPDPARPGPQADTAPLRVTWTPGESIGAYLAWNGDRVGLAWSDDTVGQHEVYFQSFDRDGAPQGEARRVTWSSQASLIPAIRPWGTGFALAWNEYVAPADSQHGGHGGRSHIATAIVR